MTIASRHLTTGELEAGLEEIGRSPKDGGALEMIVRRPRVGEREILQEGQLDLDEGLVGDSWMARARARTPGIAPNLDTQLNVMNARVVALVSQDRGRWQLAGDQLYLDLDLSEDNLPAGSRLAIGSAVIEVSPVPHTGCAKFVERFGLDAMKFVNAAEYKAMHMRGINARVVQPGVIHVGDRARKLSRESDYPDLTRHQNGEASARAAAAPETLELTKRIATPRRPIETVDAVARQKCESHAAS
jgi:hypothetical protein